MGQVLLEARVIDETELFDQVLYIINIFRYLVDYYIVINIRLWNL